MHRSSCQYQSDWFGNFHPVMRCLIYNWEKIGSNTQLSWLFRNAVNNSPCNFWHSIISDKNFECLCWLYSWFEFVLFKLGTTIKILPNLHIFGFNTDVNLYSPEGGAIIILCRKIVISPESNLHWTSDQSVNCCSVEKKTESSICLGLIMAVLRSLRMYFSNQRHKLENLYFSTTDIECELRLRRSSRLHFFAHQRLG